MPINDNIQFAKFVVTSGYLASDRGMMLSESMSQITPNQSRKVISLLDEAYTCRINDLKRSTHLGEEALAMSEAMNDKPLIAKSLSQLSLFYMIMGNYSRSMEFSEKAIKYYEELRDEKGIADAKYSIAGVYYKTDNYHLGLIYLIDCLSTFKKFDDHHNQARAYKSVGTIYEYFGDEKNAVKSYESSIKAARKVNDLNLESNAYNPLSGIYIKQGKIKKAAEIIESAIRMKKQTGDLRGLAFSLYGRGKVYTHTGCYEEAEADFFEALKIHENMSEHLGISMTYNKMGALYVAMGDTGKAKEILNKALQFSQEHNIAIIKFKSNYWLYKVCKLEGSDAQALEYLEQYLKQKEAVINTQTLKVIENYELMTRVESLKKEAQLQREKAEIIEKKNRAEHEAKVKQDFLSNMSHEIRTPLNAVIMAASLLSQQADPEEKPLVQSLQSAANSLLNLVNDVLDFTRLDSGILKLDIKPAPLKPLLKNIRNIFEPLAGEKGLKLTLKLSDEIADNYEMDQTRLSQIMNNLVSNAIKFTKSGKVEIICEKTGETPESDLLRFRVKDSGIGIPAKDFDSIFESFSQPLSITTKKAGGSGLGLSIVSKLIELYKSKVYIKSEVGRGSEFYFDLILKRSGNIEKRISFMNDQLKGKRVLMAEDNLINAIVNTKLLSNWGVVIELAKNGLEALEKTRNNIFDFILMDIHMPEMDGFEATRHIRTVKNPNSNTPIFALTADITAEAREEYNSFFNGFLRKPVEIDKLFDALVSGR